MCEMSYSYQFDLLFCRHQQQRGAEKGKRLVFYSVILVCCSRALVKVLQSLRIHLHEKFADGAADGAEHGSGGLKINIRLLDSSKIERFFDLQDSTQVRLVALYKRLA